MVCSSAPAATLLDADGMATDGHVLLDGKFRAIGGVRLSRVTVGRQLNCSGGTIERLGGVALDLTGLVGHGDVELSCGFRAVGEVRMWGATVSRDVTLLMGQLGNCGGTAFDAHGMQTGGNLVWRLAGKPEGGIDLSFAEVARLKDDKTSWQTDDINLNGFTYRSIDSELPVEDRIDILKRAHYAYQPYQHLAGIYRGAGQDRQTRKVVMAREDDRTRRGNLKWHSRVWNRFLRATVGYGYNLWLPFVVVLALGFANGFIYHAAEHDRLIEATSGKQVNDGKALCPDDTPCFSPWAYSYQLLIPAVNLQQLDKFSPDAKRKWGQPWRCTRG